MAILARSHCIAAQPRVCAVGACREGSLVARGAVEGSTSTRHHVPAHHWYGPPNSRRYVLVAGSVAIAGTGAELLENPDVGRLFLGTT
jgi:hypothetical protein